MQEFERRNKIARMRMRVQTAQYVLVAILAIVCILTVFFTIKPKEPAKKTKIDLQPDWRTQIEEPIDITKEDKDNPHRLVDRRLLLSIEDINPVRIVEGTGGLKASIIDPTILGMFMKRVNETTAAQLRQMAITSFEYNDFNDPKARMAVRGCVLSFRGSLRRFQESKLGEKARTTLARYGITHCYEGEIQDSQYGLYSFRCVDNIERKWENGDVVDLTGVFYKLIKYPNQAGKEQGTPLILAKKLVFVKAPPVRSTTTTLTRGLPDWVIALGLAGSAFIVILIVVLAMRRKPPALRTPPDDIGDLNFEERLGTPEAEEAPAEEPTENEEKPEDAGEEDEKHESE